MRLPFTIPSAATAPFDVVTFGLNSIDLVAVVAEFPANNTKQRLQRFAHLPGGQMATAAATCARLGWRARYIGCFGDDGYGKMARDSLIAEGVNIDAAWIAPGATNQFAVVIVDGRSGSRTVLWDRHRGLTIDPARVPKAAVESGRLLIVDCHETAAGIGELLQSIDAIIAAQSFPTELTGYDTPGRALEAMAREFAAPLVCVTLAEEGSLARCHGREFRTPAFPVDCVDTTGAGDAFRAGFAAGCLSLPDGDVQDVLAYANAVAALNCRGLGARGGMPDRDEVERLVMARGLL